MQATMPPPTYEVVFLAIAVKNLFMTEEAARGCLAGFNVRAAARSPRPIETIALEKGLLTDEQINLLSAAARKVCPPEPAPAPPPPSRNSDEPIPGVRVAGKLGTGGTATVFLADDVRSNRRVALKIIHPKLAKDPKAMERFQREASLLIEFDHPRIVKGYEQGMMGPLAYFLMEFIDGETAQQIIEHQKKIDEERALVIIEETAEAIEYMKGRGYVHRDIKPGNIMLLKDGRVKVIDLGFAQKISEADSGRDETTSGTAQYMSPEQARGQSDLDVRADIYSLGATLYHMVVGRLPFQGGDSVEVMAKHVMEDLNSSEIKNRRISNHMHYFIERMMSKDKDLRYSSPQELISDIKERLEGFRSLQYRPGADTGKSSIERMISGEPANAPGGAKKNTTRVFRPLTRRGRKN